MFRKISLSIVCSTIIVLVSCGGGQIGVASGTGAGPTSAGAGQIAAFQSGPSFSAGLAHVAGNYGFTQENYLLEGAERIQQLGAKSIFVYLTRNYQAKYPDRSAGMWSSHPSTLAQLAQTVPYATLFAMPFKTFLLTTYSFANDGQIDGMSTDSSRQQAEENEFYALTKHLYAKYAGSGRTFILKNWEGDWIGLQDYDTSKDIAPSRIADMIAWLSARQRGVARARSESKAHGVTVLNAVEVNRVLDYVQNGLQRVINAVVPAVKPDIVTYSSYDSTSGHDPATVQSSMQQALETIKQLTPDPLGLGDRRILISEFGMFENERNDVSWRADEILSIAKSEGLAGAYLWNVFDNECKDSNGQYAGVGLDPWDPGRPADSQCRGLWAIRPDGTTSSVVKILQKYW